MKLASGLIVPDRSGGSHPPYMYKDAHRLKYTPPNATSYTDIEVLEFLKGQPWDDLALNYVHALRPSSLRVSTGCVPCDAQRWRVTVYVDKNNIITSIHQEVEVGLVGAKHGHDLHCQLMARKKKV